MNTQNKQVLKHLKKKGSITPMEALNLFGCFRLAARIFDLHEEGHDIKPVMTESRTKHGKKRFATYYLIQKKIK